MRNKALLFAGAAMLALLAGCGPDVPTSDQKINVGNEQLANQAAQEVGLPGIVNFTEKKLVKQLYELRDNPNLRTYTYILDLNGNFHYVCDSLGFGIPYAVQFSNPDKVIGDYEHRLTLPQSEPNGLFPPAGAEGTWVMCLDPADKKVKASYIEPPVTVMEFPLAGAIQPVAK